MCLMPIYFKKKTLYSVQLFYHHLYFLIHQLQTAYIFSGGTCIFYTKVWKFSTLATKTY